jgi:hypothetical protein
MKFLKALIRGICPLALPVALIGSTIAQEGAVLLHQENFNEVVSLSRTDAGLLRNFYVVLDNLADARLQGARESAVIAPFSTPSLSNYYSGSFIVNTAAPKHTEKMLMPAALAEDKQTKADTLQLYVGRANFENDRAVDDPRAPDVTLSVVGSRLPIDTLSFVRFDIKEWQVLESVVSYDIDISYWGPRSAAEQGVIASL